MATTKAVKNQAAYLFIGWRAEGIPAVITSHEAHRLSGGAIGVEGDHGTALSLAKVAVTVAQEQQQRQQQGVS